MLKKQYKEYFMYLNNNMYILQLHPLENHTFTFIDDDMVEDLSKYKWYMTKRKTVSYAVADVVVGTKKVRTYLHRFIMNITGRNNLIDHIDGNGLNNIKSNLRITDHSGNHNNVKLKNTNTSGTNGVYIIDRFVFNYKVGEKQKSKAFNKLEDAENALIDLNLKRKLYHYQRFCFQWNENKQMKTKRFKDMEELIEFRKMTYERIVNMNGIRK